MNFIKYITISIIGVLTTALPAEAGQDFYIADAKVIAVYVHDCCGRGPYVAVVLNQKIPDSLSACNPYLDSKNIVATSVAGPLAKSFLATAILAKTSNSNVDIWYSDSCDTTLVFNELKGLRVK